jgi:hypothetical protein
MSSAPGSFGMDNAGMEIVMAATQKAKAQARECIANSLSTNPPRKPAPPRVQDPVTGKISFMNKFD